MAMYSPPAAARLFIGTTAATTASSTWTSSNTATSSTAYVTIPVGTSIVRGTHITGTPSYLDDWVEVNGWSLPRELEIKTGMEHTIKLPDGTLIDIAKDGSFTINDKDAKVTYRANRVRDFNSFVNASDKLESFIKFCGTLGVRSDEMLNIPVKHFIAWLIIEAARADGEQADVKLLDGIHAHVKPPRCVSCGRFISRKLTARKVAVCRAVCLERQLEAA